MKPHSICSYFTASSWNNSGCIWDQTGCSNGCDMEAMDARCDRMSHDQVPPILMSTFYLCTGRPPMNFAQEMCEGSIGALNRCTWSHGASGAQMNVDIRFGDIGEDSTLDIMLIVAGIMTSLFIIHQLYRWFTRNGEYHKLQDTQHHDEIQITSHAVWTYVEQNEWVSTWTQSNPLILEWYHLLQFSLSHIPDAASPSSYFSRHFSVLLLADAVSECNDWLNVFFFVNLQLVSPKDPFWDRPPLLIDVPFANKFAFFGAHLFSFSFIISIGM